MSATKFSFTDTVKQRLRDGFVHTSILMDGSVEVATGTAHWSNRTWEPYDFYTSRKNAVKNALESTGRSKERMTELQALLDTFNE